MRYCWVLSQIPPEIFCLWWSCSHCTVSEASTSLAISFCHLCSQLLYQSVATCATESAGLGLSSSSCSAWKAQATLSQVPFRQTGYCQLPHTLICVCSHSLMLSLILHWICELTSLWLRYRTGLGLGLGLGASRQSLL